MTEKLLTDLSIEGKFKLETQWRPLPHILDGKLRWVRLLAEKKQVHLSIIDSTVATEFGLLSTGLNFIILLSTKKRPVQSIEDSSNSAKPDSMASEADKGAMAGRVIHCRMTD